VLACTFNRAPSIAVGVTPSPGPGFFEEAMVGSSWVTAILEEPANPAPLPKKGARFHNLTSLYKFLSYLNLWVILVDGKIAI
jgi:hypothetical protein